MKLIRLILFIGLCLSIVSSVHGADEIVLKDKHPSSYQVKRGDTLWEIASRFLRDPWRWPDIWYVNPQIHNPHVIYPGDEVVLTYKDGKPRLELRRGASHNGLRIIKLTPEIRKQELSRPIPTIPIDAIQQFLSRPRIITRDEAKHLPYVVSSQDAHLVAGSGDKVYASGILPSENNRYTIIRSGQTFRDSDRGKNRVLGHEAIYVGEALVTQYGDPSTLEVTQSEREILRGDLLIPATAQQLDYNFVPNAPIDQVRGQIIAVVDGVSRIGQYQVVVINRGTSHGMDKGHVLAVYQTGTTVRDTVREGIFGSGDVTLPDERIGYLMVFRPFEKLSYALVMKATRDMQIYDMVVNP
ncbi:MAG: LysM peptidoglycan-binding domain-containing protein [Gammaproteobacteria bacterium]|nr:LysM peptidoglycan-binding domain-containing protein [Gammaproteobacteria bacterium]